MRWAAAYAAALVVVGVLDALWLGWLARDFYRREIGSLMVEEIRWIPAALFYVGYPAALVALVMNPMPATLGAAASKAALLGLTVYAVYDLTNMATLKHWSVQLALVDVAWGTFVAGMAGVAAWWAMQAITR